MKILFVTNNDLGDKTAQMLTSYCSGNGFFEKNPNESLNADQFKFRLKGDLSVDVLNIGLNPNNVNLGDYNLIVGFDKRQADYFKENFNVSIPLFNQVACCNGDKTAITHEESAKRLIPTFAYKMTIYDMNSLK